MTVKWMDKAGKSKVLVAWALFMVVLIGLFIGIISSPITFGETNETYVNITTEDYELLTEEYDQLLTELNSSGYIDYVNKSMVIEEIQVVGYSCSDVGELELQINDSNYYKQEFWFSDVKKEADNLQDYLFGLGFGITSLPNVVYNNDTQLLFSSRTETSDHGIKLDGPVLYMNFNKDAEGTYVQDNSIYNNWGNNSGATWNSSCGVTDAGNDLGGCFDFDGVDDYVDLNTPVFPTDGSSWTASAWAKLDGDSNDGTILAQYGVVGNDDGRMVIKARTSTGKWSLFFGHTSGHTFLDLSDYTVGEWVNVVYTYNGSSVNGYIDGKLINSSGNALSGNIYNGETWIGNDQYSVGGRELNGQIDNVQIFDRALSATEIANLYNGSVNNTDYWGKYANNGSFTSPVFYNSTSTYWNVTQSIADSDYIDTLDYVNQSGLVSYWRLDGDVTDSVGGNDGTNSGSSDTIGIVGHARSFDGVDDYVNFDDFTETEGISQITYSVWVKKKENGQRQHILGDWSYTNGEGQRIEYQSNNIPRFTIETSESGNIDVESDSEITDFNWHHIVGVYNETNLLLYIDGIEQLSKPSISGNTMDNIADFQLGISGDKSSYPFNGSIDEVLIFNRSLSSTEISEIYNEQKKYYGVDMFEEYGVFDDASGVTATHSDSLNFDTTDSFSISNWIKYDSSMGTGFIWAKQETGSDYRGYSLYWDGDEFVIYISNDNSPQTRMVKKLNGVSWGDNTWRHLTITYDGTASFEGLKMWVDGIEQDMFESGDTITISDTIQNTNDFAIGFRAGSTAYSECNIDEVLVFNSSLTQSEITSLYNSKFKLDDYSHNNLVSHWDMDGNFNDRVGDNDGTATNGAYTTDGLVSYWPLDESFDDLVGGNDGTQSGGVTNATGLSSGAMNFDGVNDYVKKDVSDFQISDNSGSICSWFMLDTASINNYIFTSSDEDTTTYLLSLYVRNTNKLSLYLSFDSGTNHVISGDTTLLANQWYHGCLVSDGTSYNIYLDGKDDGANVASGSNDGKWFGDIANRDNIAIGALERTSLVSPTFDGQIDEVLIYDRSLDSSEVSDLYKAGLSQHANTNITLQTRTANNYNLSDEGLVGLWGFNGDANDELGVNNGTVSGATLGDSYGVVGQGYNFDGSSNNINLGADVVTSDLDEFSVSLWAKQETQADTQYVYVRTGNYYQYYIASDGRIVMDLNSGSLRYQQIVPTGFMPTGEWVHLVFTYNRTESVADERGEIFVNTKDVGEVGLQIGNPVILDSSPDYIGRDVASFDGAIDEVRIYNRSLSAAEIQNLYELGSHHIEWGSWSDAQAVQDGVALTSSSSGKFIQYKDSLITDDTDVSAYVLNQSVKVAGGNTPPNVTILYPLDNYNYSQNITGLNYTVMDDYGVSHCWWFNGTLNSTPDSSCNNITGLNIGEGRYNWIVYVNDTEGEVSSVNTSFVVDTTKPIISLNYPINNRINLPQNITFNFTVTDNLATSLNCSIYLDNILNKSNSSTNNGSLSNFNINLIPEGVHYWNISCNDDSGNKNFSETRNFVVNVTPILDNVSSSHVIIKGGEVVTINPDGIRDPQNNTLYYYCSDNTLPTSSNTNCSQGNAQYTYPYSSMTCSFASAGNDATNTVYCRTYDGRYYSNASQVNYTSDSSPPSTAIISVAGDVAATYYDNVNDGVTNITISGEENMLCRFYDSDQVYNPALGTACIIDGTSAYCLATTVIQGLDVANYYVNCADNYSNGQSSSQNEDVVSLVIDWTKPTTTDNSSEGTYLLGYKVNISEIDNLAYGAGGITTYYCNDTTNTCNPTTSIDNAETITFNSRGINYLRYYSVDSAGNTQTNQSKNITINNLPTFTSAVDDATTIKGGSLVTVTTVTLENDTDQNISLYICNSTNFNSSGCIDTEYCSNITESYNSSCSFTAETDNSLHTWYAFIYDTLDEKAATNKTGSYTTDSSAPTLTVLSPENNSLYSQNSLSGGIILSENGNWAGYCLDDCSSNVSLSQVVPTYWTITISSISNGNHNITFYANDSYGNMGTSSLINFSVDTTLNDTTEPTITVWSPVNGTYYSNTSVFFRITTDETTTNGSYSLDGVIGYLDNVSATEWNKTVVLAEGVHNVTFYANDTASTPNQGNSSLVEFYVDITSPIINSTNNTPVNVNENNNLSCYAYVYDAVGLNYSYIEHNATGIFVNSSIMPLSGNDGLVNYTIDSINLSAGLVQCKVYVYDNVGLVNSSSWLINVTDATEPNITNIVYEPSSTDELDPNSIVIVNATVTDNVNVDSVVLNYNNGTWNNISMSNIIGNIYQANFTTSNSGYYAFYLNASDGINNNLSEVYNLSVFYDNSWVKADTIDFSKAISREDRGITHLGNITINNTGEYDLEFIIGVSAIPMLFNDSLNKTFTLSANSSIYLNVSANTTELLVNTTHNYNITITTNSSDNETLSGFIRIDNSLSPYVYPSINTTVIQEADNGDIISLLSTAQNIGGDDATGTWLAWELPEGFSLISGTLNKSIGFLGVGTSSTSTINIQVDSGVTDGTYTVNSLTSADSTDVNTDSVSIIVGAATTTTTTTITTPSTSGGGGGGSTGRTSGTSGYIEKLLQTEELYELVRGDDNNFTLTVENPFEGILNNVEIDITGFLSQYLFITPSVINGIKANESSDFIVSIAAPKYFTKGTYYLNFTITGMIEKESGEGNVTWVSKKKMKESRLIILDIHETGRGEALEYINLSSSLIDSVNVAGLNIKPLNNLFEDMNKSFEKRDYEKVKSIYQTILEDKESAFAALEIIKDIESRVNQASQEGIDLPKTERLLSLSKSALDRGDYKTSLERANDAKITYALERTGINVIAFMINNWGEIIIGAISLSIVSYLSLLFIRLGVTNKKLKDLKKEENILLGLIKEIQIECFEKNKMTMKEYTGSLLQYEKRMGKVIQEIVRLETLKVNIFKLFKPEIKRLLEEKQKLLKLIKKTQELYINSRKIETHVYQNRMRSYAERFAEIDEKLADLEAKKAIKGLNLKKFNLIKKLTQKKNFKIISIPKLDTRKFVDKIPYMMFTLTLITMALLGLKLIFYDHLVDIPLEGYELLAPINNINIKLIISSLIVLFGAGLIILLKIKINKLPKRDLKKDFEKSLLDIKKNRRQGDEKSFRKNYRKVLRLYKKLYRSSELTMGEKTKLKDKIHKSLKTKKIKNKIIQKETKNNKKINKPVKNKLMLISLILIFGLGMFFVVNTGEKRDSITGMVISQVENIQNQIDNLNFQNNTIINPPELILNLSEESLEVQKELNLSQEYMDEMDKEGFNTKRYNDTLIIARQTYEAQRALGNAGGITDYSLIYDKLDELKEIKENAYISLDEINALEYTIEQTNMMDEDVIKQLYNQVNESFNSERYEETLVLIDKIYEKMSELEAIDTKLKAFYDVTSRSVTNFLKSHWKGISSSLILLIILFIITGHNIRLAIIKNKISNLSNRKMSIKKLIAKTQKEYFESGKLNESTYKARTTKYSELVRDINRQIPLLKEKLEIITRKRGVLNGFKKNR